SVQPDAAAVFVEPGAGRAADFTATAPPAPPVAGPAARWRPVWARARPAPPWAASVLRHSVPNAPVSMRRADRPASRCDPCERPEAVPARHGAAACPAAGPGAGWKTRLRTPAPGSRGRERPR